MIISPLCALTGTPFTSMLTRSSLMRWRPCLSCRLRSQLLHDAPSAVIHHVLELMPVMLEETLHRPGGGITESADGVPFDSIGHVQQQIQLVAPRLSRENALQQPVHPARSFAARRALPAGLRHVEARDALEHTHHAGGLIHHDYGGRADGRAGGAQRVVIHVRLEHYFTRHYRHR